MAEATGWVRRPPCGTLEFLVIAKCSMICTWLVSGLVKKFKRISLAALLSRNSCDQAEMNLLVWQKLDRVLGEEAPVVRANMLRDRSYKRQTEKGSKMNYSKALNECTSAAYMVAGHFRLASRVSAVLVGIAMSNHSYSVWQGALQMIIHMRWTVFRRGRLNWDWNDYSQMKTLNGNCHFLIVCSFFDEAGACGVGVVHAMGAGDVCYFWRDLPRWQCLKHCIVRGLVFSRRQERSWPRLPLVEIKERHIDRGRPRCSTPTPPYSSW